MGEIINVIDLAKSIKGQIAEFVSQRANNGEIIPKIASIVVGEDGGSIFYINSQEKVANSLGILFEKILLKTKKLLYGRKTPLSAALFYIK